VRTPDLHIGSHLTGSKTLRARSDIMQKPLRTICEGLDKTSAARFVPLHRGVSCVVPMDIPPHGNPNGLPHPFNDRLYSDTRPYLRSYCHEIEKLDLVD